MDTGIGVAIFFVVVWHDTDILAISADMANCDPKLQFIGLSLMLELSLLRVLLANT